MQTLKSKLSQAEHLCKTQKAQWTPLRKEILTLVYTSAFPISAYDLLRKLRKSRPKAEPPTVYRTLEFLQKHRLIHRIEKENAYFACEYPEHHHPGYFLICLQCGEVNEMDAPILEKTILEYTQQHSFLLKNYTIEISGLCKNCA